MNPIQLCRCLAQRTAAPVTGIAGAALVFAGAVVAEPYAGAPGFERWATHHTERATPPFQQAIPPVTFECLVEPWSVSEVGSHSRGVVKQWYAERGDVVTAGQPLITLENRVERNQVELAEERASLSSEITARDAERRLSRIEYERVVELNEEQLISEQERDKGKAHVQVAQASYIQAIENRRLMLLELKRSLSQLRLKTIYSPLDGVVVERLVDTGELAHNNPLMVVAQLHPLRIEVVLQGEYFGQIRAGDQAQVSLSVGSEQTHQAEVVLVDPVFDSHSGTFGVRLALSNADYAIPSGQRCQVHIQLNQSQGQEQPWIQARQQILNERQEPTLQAASGDD